MTKNTLFLFIFFLSIVLSKAHADNLFCSFENPLPGRIGSSGIQHVQLGSTDVFFYMSEEKFELIKKIVEEINLGKVNLTVDINDYDCLTTELSAISSKYPDPISYNGIEPVFADISGHLVLDSFAHSLTELIASQTGLNLQGVSREINFIVNQDAHKFHQDQSAKQFSFLNSENIETTSSKIIQDLTLIDWDMSVDTLSATIIQDSESNERFLFTLFPKEAVGMLFTQSSIYLNREAHPSYQVPTIFPYHAVLSPIDRNGSKTPGSSKGKRLSTVLRGVVTEEEIEQLKSKSSPLKINRPIAIKDEKGSGLVYPNTIIAREIPDEANKIWNGLNLNEGWVYKHSDKENVEIFEISSSAIDQLAHLLSCHFEVCSQINGHAKLLRLIKKDGGFSRLDLMGLKIKPESQIFILNATSLTEDYDYYNLAQDMTSDMLPWIQLYHLPKNMVFKISGLVFNKLSLTPIEEILFRKAAIDSMKTDGLSSIDKIVTKLDIIVFEE